jgi:hypothetical protein
MDNGVTYSIRTVEEYEARINNFNCNINNKRWVWGAERYQGI